jgi:anti-sigma factor RsiW
MMKYFDGELSEDEKLQFMEHLNGCKACSIEFECMNGIFDTLGKTGLTEPPENFEINIMERVNQMEKKRKAMTARFLVILYNMAAVFSILLLVFFAADLDRAGLVNALADAGVLF